MSDERQLCPTAPPAPPVPPAATDPAVWIIALGLLAYVLTAEQGRPTAESRGEVAAVAAWCRYYADLEIGREVPQDDATARIQVTRRPMGVGAAITPWNFPLTLASWKFAPALRAGNTVVLKPSPYTPLATLRMGELLAQVLPPGVFSVVSGGDDLGGRLTAHPVPRKIVHRSVATGRRVAAAAPDLKRVTLELGGNDPCGTAWVNTHLVLPAKQPFGGTKWSGVGTENGRWGLHGLTDIAVLHRARA